MKNVALSCVVLLFVFVTLRAWYPATESPPVAHPEFSGSGFSSSDEPNTPSRMDDGFCGNLERLEVRDGNANGDSGLGNQDVTFAGKVVLADDSPLVDTRVLAVDAREAIDQTMLQRGGSSPPHVLCDTTTDGKGEFRFPLRIERPFRIYHLGPPSIQQMDTIYGAKPDRHIIHRLPTGRIRVRTVAEGDVPIAGTALRLQFSDGGTANGYSSVEGLCDFFLQEACEFDVYAYNRESRLGAVATKCDFMVVRPCEVVLMLRRMESGMFGVRVTDQTGAALEKFAIRILDHGDLVRHVTSSQLWRGEYVLGLPERTLDIRLDQCYTGSPAMYDVNNNELKQVTANSLGSDEVVFRVKLLSTVALDIENWSETLEPIYVTIRSDGTASAPKSCDMLQYNADGMRVSRYIDGPGRWYVAPMAPGLVLLEAIQGEYSILSEWIDLVAGRTEIRSIRCHDKKVNPR